VKKIPALNVSIVPKILLMDMKDIVVRLDIFSKPLMIDYVKRFLRRNPNDSRRMDQCWQMG